VALSNIYIDQLDQIYIIDNKGTLTRYDKHLQPQYIYADRTLGPIHSVDVGNPLQIIVYHADYGIISYLDNSLSTIKKQNIQDWEYYDVSTIASTNDGNIWMYDPVKIQLLKINDNGEILVSSNNLHDYHLQNLEPIKIIEKNNKVFILDATYGIIIFDNLGQYLKVLPITSINDFQTDGRNIYIYEDNNMVSYSTKLLERYVFDIDAPKSTPQNIILSTQWIYYIYHDGVDRKRRDPK
jgi:hypothetical protein